ncbi:MAG: hypothetical protein AAFU86_11515 [Pseudomonadota bacterium]
MTPTPGASDRTSFWGSPTATRVLAAVQLVGGAGELIVAGGALLAPEPTGATKVLGYVVLLHGMDTVQSAVRTIVSGERVTTLTHETASGACEIAGGAPGTCETVGIVTDVSIGVGGSFAVGALTRVPHGTSQLVHLTDEAGRQGITASQTLGRGTGTVYAGPQSLANTYRYQILTTGARTSRTLVAPSKTTEVMLLPSRAGQSFLVVQPMGPISGWQRLNGAVFSAGVGTFNMQTGVFTRTAPAMNQLAIYGIDSAVMATMRTSAAAAQSEMDQTNRCEGP